MFNLRRLLAISIVVAVMALGGAICWHLLQQDPLEVFEALPEQVDLSLEKLHYTQNEDGKRSWTLDADTAEYQRGEGQAVLDAVQLIMYEAGQFGELKLTAEHGLFLQEQQQVDVWGDVVVVTSKGDHLYTERLRYDGQESLLTSDEKVHLVSPRMELVGTGLWADVELGQLRLKKDIWMMLLPEERK
ncbi:LPS export ABC transporter periplasmic protein LptC [Malonomonas rubra]|uniref:LPS export ABC transporter periplasmic protein LptC n=1 Tax=Malonomonas rubra TaxID=57040 RepID=UPI0026EB9740|nr:LPS export ABC transporter periplasmic protein LptC [Malonomonas rubra]